MRMFCALVAALVLCGCTTNPPPSTGTRAPPPVTYAATDVPEATTLDEATKLGYKLVDDSGRTLYCKEWPKLGSRIQKERVCLTEEEFTAARSQQQRTFDKMKKPGPIPYEGPQPRPRGQ